MGTVALVTGASSGLGEGFARELAVRCADLVLVARRQDRLEALAVDLAEKFGTVSTVIPLDLAAPGAVAELVADLSTRKIPIGTLVNSAGFGTVGNFIEADAAREAEQIALNVQAVTILTRALLPDLVATAAREPGAAALVNFASTAAFQAVPRMSVYAASKAYVLSFTEALWYETRGTGLKVTAVCPGLVDTEFSDVAQRTTPAGERPRRSLTVDDVVRSSFAALDRAVTPPLVVNGSRNRMLAQVSTLAPRRAVLTVLGRRRHS
ncbi:SDR family oxidoreductase [Cryobacterium melibiosiphilum]|uniref:SDR family oxidoreductase n=2 Tax=Cryobacterium melibiosiphilum TaxID=995039 RepID=A0A3A5MN82_9MICO|nr:SDR family oxidoreductase [Cryobacterium melibiosiphilum]